MGSNYETNYSNERMMSEKDGQFTYAQRKAQLENISKIFGVPKPKSYTNPTTLPDGYYWFKGKVADFDAVDWYPIQVKDNQVWEFGYQDTLFSISQLKGTFEELKHG